MPVRKKYIGFVLLGCSFMLCFVYACQKWMGKTEADVYILEEGSTKAVQNAEVHLLEGTPGNTFGVAAWHIKKTCTTDAEGHCFFKFEADNDNSYKVVVSHENYYKDRQGDYDVDPGEDNILTISLKPEAWLKVYIKNVDPVNKDDKILICSIGGNPIGGGTFHGMYVDTFTFGRVSGNESQERCYEVTKNNVTNKHWYSVYVDAHDTTEYTIEY